MFCCATAGPATSTAAPASRASVMRFMVFSVGDLITRVATRVLMTPAKKTRFYCDFLRQPTASRLPN
jgi:hypothetical protein